MIEQNHEALREILCEMGAAVRDRVLEARRETAAAELASVAVQTEADAIFRVDLVAEEAITDFCRDRWPSDSPVEIVMEGIDGSEPVTYPVGTSVNDTQWKCILDPIDGTRCWMHDKRPAWFLGAVAPQRREHTCLGDIVAVAMVEIPTTKQGLADRISAIRGCGARGVKADRRNLFTGAVESISLYPSTTDSFANRYGQFVRYFPGGKAETAEIEERLWKAVMGRIDATSSLVFEDQYASTGGQIYELASGRDLMTCDIRPLVLPKLGLGAALTCHPYDICTAMILEELGGVVEDPVKGGRLCQPLDTTTPVTWVGYANTALAEKCRPIIRELLAAWATSSQKE